MATRSTSPPAPGCWLKGTGARINCSDSKRSGALFHLEVTADEAARWGAAYATELADMGKTASQVADECRARAAAMAPLAALLIDNFLAGLDAGQTPA